MLAAHQEARAAEKVATKTNEILNGTLHVPVLSGTTDTTEKMDRMCQHCGAYKFKSKTARVCCLEGKVDLDVFLPLQRLSTLCGRETQLRQNFQNHSRSLNNAVCLASLAVNKWKLRGYHPYIIFQGRVTHLTGPLQAEPGENPTFAQLYVLDPHLEQTRRFAT